MTPTVQFSYYLSGPENPVYQEDPIWNRPLALSRNFKMSAIVEDETHPITIGDYFLATRLFLETCGIDFIVHAAEKRFAEDINPEDIEDIAIFLVKHGEFYHPARIEVSLHARQIHFVLNVAISPAGKAHIQGEYRYLKRLHKDYLFDYLPQVYGWHEVKIANNRIPMFLGEWLTDYHEFHISRDPADGKNKIIVWDSGRQPSFLTESQSLDLYTRAAGILTGYYNLETFEQICAWHHAAGDFIVRLEKDQLDLKLITVRRYGPNFAIDHPGSPDDGAEHILQALLVYFLNLCLKMRLDRLDGVGDIVWADDRALQGTLIGFLNALAAKTNIPALPDSPLRCFFHYLCLCSKTDLQDLYESLLKRFNSRSPEIDVIHQHLDSHIDALFDGIHNL